MKNFKTLMVILGVVLGLFIQVPVKAFTVPLWWQIEQSWNAGSNTATLPMGTSSLPGDIIYTHSAITSRSGFLLCDGSTYSSGTYPALFSAIATTTLPNFQGVFPKGMGSQTIGGVTYSGATANPQADKIQGHYHNILQNSQDTVDNLSQYQGHEGTGSVTSVAGPDSAINALTWVAKEAMTDGTNGTPRTSTITEPANVGVKIWIKY